MLQPTYGLLEEQHQATAQMEWELHSNDYEPQVEKHEGMQATLAP